MDKETQINDVCEATLITTALKYYASDLRARFDTDNEELKIILQYIATVYRKYNIVAKTPVVYDALGNLVLKDQHKRDNYKLN